MGEPAGTVHFDPLLAIDVPVAKPAGKKLSLERWTYEPETVETRLSDLGFILLLVDAGSLTVQITPGVDGSDPVAGGKRGTAVVGQARPAGAPEYLEPGDAVTVPQGGRITVRNDGVVPAVAFAVVATGPAPSTWSMMEQAGPPTGIEHAVQASGPIANLPVGDMTVEIGRIALAPEPGCRPRRSAPLRSPWWKRVAWHWQTAVMRGWRSSRMPDHAAPLKH